MFPEKETSIKSNPAEMTGDANLGFAIPKVECQQADVAMAKKSLYIQLFGLLVQTKRLFCYRHKGDFQTTNK